MKGCQCSTLSGRLCGREAAFVQSLPGAKGCHPKRRYCCASCAEKQRTIHGGRANLHPMNLDERREN